MKEKLVNIRKLTPRELAEDLNIGYGFVYDIVVNDMDLRRVAAELVTMDRNFMQKRDRVDITKGMISKAELGWTHILPLHALGTRTSNAGKCSWSLKMLSTRC